MEKKCKHCATMIPAEALVCPQCHKRLRQSTTTRVIIGGVLLLFIIGLFQTSGNTPTSTISNSAAVKNSSMPAFTVVGKNQKSMSVLVSKNFSSSQLKKLILGFRKARIENNLGSLIPPTTSGGSFGNYAFVDIYVFTDPLWATSEKLQRLNNVRLGEKAYPREFVKHVKASYFYSVTTGEEGGSIGMEDTSGVRSSDYKKLF